MPRPRRDPDARIGVDDGAEEGVALLLHAGIGGAIHDKKMAREAAVFVLPVPRDERLPAVLELPGEPPGEEAL